MIGERTYNGKTLGELMEWNEHSAPDRIAVEELAAHLGDFRLSVMGLIGALGLQRTDDEILKDYGELGLDALNRAREVLAGGTDD